MNSDYEKTIYTYCDDVIRFARTLDYDMKKDMVISRLKSDNVYLYDYEIIIESMIEVYFEVPCQCTVI